MDELIPHVVHVNDARPKCLVEPIDRQRAATLRAFVQHYPKWGKTRSARVWEQSFAILRRGMAGGDGLIDGVLSWYVGWFQPGKRPEIANGKQFRERWDWLLQIWEREQSATLPESELSPDGKWVRDELTMLMWNPTADAQLSGAIHESLKNIDVFGAAMSRAVLPGAVRDVIETVIAEPRSYITKWFSDVWHRTHNWMDWNGNLMREVWHHHHTRFERDVKTRIQSYTGLPSDGVWTTLINQLEL